MKIKRVNISNFRKLKNIKIDVENKHTLFVGANNSGKTSAMKALIKLLPTNTGTKVSLYDFTISNWKSINQLGEMIIKSEKYDEGCEAIVSKWYEISPCLDVWLEVHENDLQNVYRLIPSLDWKIGDNGTGLLGIRCIVEFKDFKSVYENYRTILDNVRPLREKAKKAELFPKDFCEYMKKYLGDKFCVAYYVLDPEKLDATQDMVELEKTSSDSVKKLIKIDVVNAQRGLNDSDNNEIQSNKLSVQLKQYYKRHSKPSDEINKEDLKLLESRKEAENKFDIILKEEFKAPIKELRDLGYPGFTDPSINVTSKLSFEEGINHESAVQYSVYKDDTRIERLPEDYTGLGYQNLISMAFKLIYFRKDWIKDSKHKIIDSFIQPLHLVLIEEPEAHLHAQVQQVFINKAYNILRNHELLKEKEDFRTQLIVSTHSSYVVKALDFASLRYFKRLPMDAQNEIPITEVVNLSNVFGKENDKTAKFVSRYIRTTHCDLFFADAAILIEGNAERMLLPNFISKYDLLTSAYMSILEIRGSHSFRLKELIKTLGLLTLIITDLDSTIYEDRGNGKRKHGVYPERNKGYVTGNNTLEKWIPCKESIDELVDLSFENKVQDDYICVVYQGETEKGLIQSTFEDALVMENLEFFKNIGITTGVCNKVKQKIVASENNSNLNQEIYNIFSDKSTKKAEFILDILYESKEELDNIKTPIYIDAGLRWLRDTIGKRHNEVMNIGEE